MNAPTPATRQANAALEAAISGEVFVPGQAGYDQARQAWNLAVDQRPAVVVVAESADDVAEAVRYARSHGLRIAPQGTGHDAGPLERLDDAMLLRTSRMRGVRSAVLPPASYRRLQKIKARYDPDQVVISNHPVWPARVRH
jgi:FAD/FMN-containing dehydrogenase